MISSYIAQGRADCAKMIAAREPSHRRSPGTPNPPGISTYTPPLCQNRVGTLHQLLECTGQGTDSSEKYGRTLLLDYVFDAGVEQAREREHGHSFRSDFGFRFTGAYPRGIAARCSNADTRARDTE